MSDRKDPGRELKDALDNYANRGSGAPAPRPRPSAAERTAASRDELGSAYQAIVTSYPGARPVTPGAPPAESPSGTSPAHPKQELLAAFDKLVEHETNRPLSPGGPVEALWKRLLQPAIIAGCVAAMGYLWFAKPAWLYPRFEPSPPPITERQATQLLIATSLMVEEFAATSGRVPTTLDELGVELPAISINDAGDGSWQLITNVGQRHYLLRASVGQSPTIEERGR